MSRTNFHGAKDNWAIEGQLYKCMLDIISSDMAYQL